MFGSSPYSDNPITWSLPIGRLFGIRIRVHLLFVLIAVVLVVRDAADNPDLARGLIEGLAFVGILFGIILLHEFGHCFGARAVGGEADEILLWPLGGLAYTQPPHTPIGHLVTTIAGPLVNVLICGACLTFLVIDHPAQSLRVVHWNPFHLGLALPYTSITQVWVSYVFSISYVLLLFNLVPMYPLDGGRIFQSLLWFRIGYRRASVIACTAGMVGAIGVGLLGLLSSEILLLGIAIFGYMTCWQQKQMLRAGDGFEESEFGYDFSKGYTSLDRSMSRTTRPKRPSLLQRWRQARAERREQREHERRRTEERMLDALLDKVHAEGLHSLTPSERRFLDHASQKRR